MKKNTLLYILLAFLIIINGFFLFQYLGKPDGKGAKGPGNFLVKELQFDALQMEQFTKIEEKHQENMDIFHKKNKEFKKQLFNRISDVTVNFQKIDSITSLISENEKTKELETFHHLRAIQDICNDKQKEKFKAIVSDALRRGRGPKGGQKGRPPPPPR